MVRDKGIERRGSGAFRKDLEVDGNSASAQTSPSIAAESKGLGCLCAVFVLKNNCKNPRGIIVNYCFEVIAVNGVNISRNFVHVLWASMA